MFKKLKKFPSFLMEVKEEVKKINWPARRELVSAAILVVICSGLLTAYIATVDLGLSKLLQFLLK